jgi:DNA-directed RNA polymerase specialized sigma24 family protein
MGTTMEEPQNQRFGPDPDWVPPFWMKSTDDHGRPLDERVVEAARRLWRWAYFQVETRLHDAPAAAELLEETAEDVSARLQTHPEVARNLTGYLITSFSNRLISQFLKNDRLVYEGLLRELEERHRLTAPDWVQTADARLTLAILLMNMRHDTRHIFHYRLLDFSWSEIGKRTGLSAKAAKSRFYYEVRKAYEQMVNAAVKRDGEKESDE